ncbi:hypothetical protein ACFWU5_16480 [Nocardia sp. NPDC058640]|uniref:hypothetical protein n=1 Tax=Nocardia sp. NPDC058640 TaxID=3346571 RepID=UPI0036578DA8
MTEPDHVMVRIRERGHGYAAIVWCKCGHSEGGFDRAKVVAQLYKHTIDANRPACPTPKKSQYGSEQEALNALSKFLQRARPGARPTRTYKCPSGRHWHTTSQPASKVA